MLLLVVLCGALPLSAQAPPTLTLDEVLSEVARQNLQLRDKSIQVEQGRHLLDRAGSRYLPILQVEANTIVWNEAIDLALGGGGAAPELPAPQTPYEGALAGLLSQLSSPITVRDQITAEARISVAQPIGSLYAIDKAHSLEEEKIKALKLEQKILGEQLSRDASNAYLQILLVEKLLDNAAASLKELQAQEKRVLTLVDNGLAVRADALRVQVAVADSQREIIRLQNMRRTALSGLALLMNRKDANFQIQSLANKADSAPPALPFALPEATQRAEDQRLQFSLLDVRDEQARIGESLAESEYIPSLNLVASYQRTEGQAFAATDQFFGGLFLSWNVFEWNATGHQVEAARSQQEQLRNARELQRQAIGFEVKSAWLEMESARESWGVAHRALGQAQEAYRAEETRFAQQAISAVDLLSAQTSLTRARNTQSIAHYQVLMALLKLRAAVGDPLNQNALQL